MPDYVRAASRILKRAVPCEGTCMLTVDPATLLPTAEISEHGLPLEVRDGLTEIELRERDFNKVHRSRPERPARGQPQRGHTRRPGPQPAPAGTAPAERFRRLTARGASRSHRDVASARPAPRAGPAPFSPAEIRFVTAMAADLGDGLRRAMLLHGDSSGDDTVHPAGAGLVVLSPDDSVETAGDAGGRCLDDLATPRLPPSRLPVAVRAVAGRTRAIAGGDTDGEPAEVRVRARSGRWVVRGSTLGDGQQSRVAILIEAAGTAAMAR